MAGERTLKVTIVGDADKLSNTFKGLGQDLGGFGSKLDDVAAKFPMLSGHVDGLKTKLGGLSGGQMAAIGGIGALGAAAGLAGTQLFKLGSDFDSAYDKIRIATGKTGKDLDALKDSFRAVAREVPSSFNDVATAIGGLSSATGLSGERLDALSLQVLNLSRVTDTDLTANVERAAKVMQDWKLSGDAVGGTLDVLFAASQRSGVQFDTLSGQIDKFGPTLRAMGLDVNESIVLLAQMGRSGADADKIMGGLTRAVTASGLSLKELTARISEGTTEADRMKIATDLLGKKVGLEFIDALKSGKLNVEDLTAAVADAHGEINETAADTDDGAEKMSKAWNRTKLALEPLSNGVFNLAGNLMDKLATAIDWVNEHAETLKRVGLALLTAGMSEVWTGLNNVWKMVDEHVLGAIRDLGGAFTTAKDAIGNALAPVLRWLDDMIGKVQWLLDHIPGLPNLTGGGTPAGQAIVNNALPPLQSPNQLIGGGAAPTNSQGGSGQTLGQMFASGMSISAIAQQTGLDPAVVTGMVVSQIPGMVLGGDLDETDHSNDGDLTPSGPGEANLTSNAVALRRDIASNFKGYTSIGGYAYRTTAAGTPSDHAKGKALDVMMPRLHAPLGDAIAAWAIGQGETNYVIWDNQIWSRSKKSQGWRDYATSGSVGRANQGSATGRHEDHVHISVLGQGGIVKARPGGTLALIGEAGRDEAVIPLPRGGDGGSVGGITINVHGSLIGGSPREVALALRDELIRAKREGVTIGLG